MTLETQQLALEGVNLNVAVLSAQKAGADAMNRATKQIGGVEGVEEIVDSVEEGLQACILPLHPPLHPPLPFPSRHRRWRRSPTTDSTEGPTAGGHWSKKTRCFLKVGC